MSGEHIINNEINTSGSREKNKNSKKKVDINILLNKVREDEKKEKFENIVFFSLVGVAIVVTGIIISL
tara:strand:+ start:369 stop:572 length:204 start_codon:yes stop_codon:yes gene_type:complete